MPWTGIPAKRSSATALKTKARALIGVLVLAACMGPIALVVSLAHKAPAPVQIAQSGATPARALASIAGAEFLAAEPYTVPVSNGITATHGAEPVTPPTSNPTQTPGPAVRPSSLSVVAMVPSSSFSKRVDGLSYTVEDFLVQTKARLYTLSVTVLDAQAGPVLAAQPSLVAYHGAPTQTLPRVDYSTDPGVQKTLPAGLRSQVAAWAQAYASDDQHELQVLANHPGPYAALGGFALTGTPQIVTVVRAGAYDYVRISALLSTSGAQRYRAEMEFDLLVLPGNDLPKIVAWGPAGDVPLTPYSNVIR